MNKPKGTKSPSSRNRNEGVLTAANLNRRADDYGITDATTNRKQISFEVKTDSSNIYAPKPPGKDYTHDFENRYGPTSGPRATTAYHGSHWTPKEEDLIREQGTNPNSDSNVPLLNEDRKIPEYNKGKYRKDEREKVASVESKPYEEAEYAKLSCWEKLMDCFKSKKKRRGGSIGGAGVTIKDLRDFLDANQDIKNILVNDECPIDPTEQMINNVDKFTDMLENYENPGITIDTIYNQDAGKRRKKTRKSKKTKKAKRRTKRRN
jgi:hypothetical protein